MSTPRTDEENANACFCVACDKCLCNELTCGNLGLSHPNPTLFVTPQWPCLPLVYTVYRGAVAIYFVTWIVLSGVWEYNWAASDSDRIKWFIYLTNWSFLVLTLDVLLQAALVVIAYGKTGDYNVTTRQDHSSHDAMPWLYKLTWIIHNVACNANVLTSIAFWGLIYEAGMKVHAVDWNTHCVNSVYVLVDTFITAIPLRLLHFYHGVTFAMLYSIFTVLYHEFGGQTNALGKPYIYSVIDWRTPRTAAVYVVIITFVAMPVVWLLLFALYRMRLAIHRCISHAQ